MKSKATLLILLFFYSALCGVNAQAPYKFTFQGIAVDDMFQPIQNASITIKISIIKSQVLGPIVFEETQPAQTGSNGMFTVVVGASGGDLSQIEWSSDVFFLKAEVDNENNGFVNNAKGKSAIALGYSNDAHQDHSIAVGHTSQAFNPFSIAIGSSATATGDYAVAFGHHTIAKANFGIAVGLFNNSFDQPNGSLTDRLFQVGNGQDINNRSNALTILRNGNIGIGNKATSAEFILDVASRMRIRNDGTTAGLYLNNSLNKPEGFMGMKTDKQVGFFLNGAWRFWVDDMGAAWTPLGQLGFASSDKRLKQNIIPLQGSLNAISQLRGYHYRWLDARRGTELQTGVIAQEIAKHFPELVQQDEKGFKTVNYIGLIPHLIESVRELKNQTAEIVELRREINELKMLTSGNTKKNEVSHNATKTK